MPGPPQKAGEQQTRRQRRDQALTHPLAPRGIAASVVGQFRGRSDGARVPCAIILTRYANKLAIRLADVNANSLATCGVLCRTRWQEPWGLLAGTARQVCSQGNRRPLEHSGRAVSTAVAERLLQPLPEGAKPAINVVFHYLCASISSLTLTRRNMLPYIFALSGDDTAPERPQKGPQTISA